MLKNIFKIARRNLIRYKTHSLINIIGLAMGITCGIIVFLVIQYEFSYDTFHKNYDKIYRVYYGDISYGEKTSSTGVPYPTHDALANDFPEIKTIAFIQDTYPAMISIEKSGQRQKFKIDSEEENVAFITSDYFDVFDVKWISGNPKSMDHPNQIILSEAFAKRFFPGENALGKTLKYNNQTDCTVAGVIEIPPSNTDVPFHIFLSFSTIKSSEKMKDRIDNWGSISSSVQCFITIDTPEQVKTIEAGLPKFADKYFGNEDASNRSDFYLQSLSDFHFNSDLSNFNFRSISKNSLLILGFIGLFLVVTACINFINLATALATKRSKEVGIRKVVGSSRKQLMFQFLGETLFIVLLSTAVAFLIMNIFSKNIVEMLGVDMTLDLLQPKLLIALPVLILVIVLLAGLYPAFALSVTLPLDDIKNNMNNKASKGIILRKTLTIAQFAISQILIIGTIIMMWQMEYMQNGLVGLNKDAIIKVNMPRESAVSLKKTTKNEISKIAGVEHVSIAYTPPVSGSVSNSNFSIVGKSFDKELMVQSLFADVDFIGTYQLELLAGTNYRASDTINGFVVNEAFIKQVDYQNPEDIIGESMIFYGVEAPITGVVKNFTTGAFYDKIRPVLITPRASTYRWISVKLNAADASNTIKQIEKIWSKSYPDNIFFYEFIDESVASFYEEEARLTKLMKIFASIAILIGCLGLFGLISFLTTQKSKEIGIRKVLGASVASIVYSFSKEFTILVLIAFAIAAPLSYYFMSDWLTQFAYKIDFGLGIFLFALVISMLIAWATVGYQSVKSAMANPVDSLMDE